MVDQPSGRVPQVKTYPQNDPVLYWQGWEHRMHCASASCQPPFPHNSSQYWQWMSGWIDADHELNGER